MILMVSGCIDVLWLCSLIDWCCMICWCCVWLSVLLLMKKICSVLFVCSLFDFIRSKAVAVLVGCCSVICSLSVVTGWVGWFVGKFGRVLQGSSVIVRSFVHRLGLSIVVSVSFIVAFVRSLWSLSPFRRCHSCCRKRFLHLCRHATRSPYGGEKCCLT